MCDISNDITKFTPNTIIYLFINLILTTNEEVCSRNDRDNGTCPDGLR